MATQLTRPLRVPEVLSAVGVGRTKLYDMVNKGEFPAPRKLGRASVWSEAEVLDWQARLFAAEAPAEPDTAEVEEVSVDDLI